MLLVTGASRPEAGRWKCLAVAVTFKKHARILVTMRAAVLLNASAGVRSGAVRAEAPRVQDLLAAHGVTARVVEVPPPEMSAAVRQATGQQVDVVVVGGGDGTVSAAAAVLAGGPTPLGILPLGTLNHFAKDLGLPLDLAEAVGVVARGRTRAVDVGQANDRVFVNNSSIGLYPRAVAGREELRARTGSHKWVAMARAAWRTLLDPPILRVTVRMLDGGVSLMTPLVFIGNNKYEMGLLGVGRREALDRGELWVYLARHTGRRSRRHLVRLALRAFLGRLDQARDFLGLGLTELLVEDRRRTLEVAFDGEVCEVTPPIRYQVRPGALRVIVP
jgi:diacylglycerol kinase family enzyme